MKVNKSKSFPKKQGGGGVNGAGRKNGPKPKFSQSFKKDGSKGGIGKFNKNKPRDDSREQFKGKSPGKKEGNANFVKQGKFKFGKRNNSDNVRVKDEDGDENDDNNFFEVVAGNGFNGKVKKEESEDENDEGIGGRGNVGMFGKKKGMSRKKMGGFQGMGLSGLVLKGIIRRGYNVPTPIQRKVVIYFLFK